MSLSNRRCLTNHRQSAGLVRWLLLFLLYMRCQHLSKCLELSRHPKIHLEPAVMHSKRLCEEVELSMPILLADFLKGKTQSSVQ